MTETRDDVEYLRNLPKDWWMNTNTIILVGRTLDKYGYIDNPWDFVEKPRRYQTLIDDFIREWKDA